MTKFPMTQSSLERVTKLAEGTFATFPHRDEVFARTSAILRKLASQDGPVEKAYAIQGHLRSHTSETQDRILSAIEALAGIGAPNAEAKS